MQKIEPYGYFCAEPFGWTDCEEDDDGAVALYEEHHIVELTEMVKKLKYQRDELQGALELARCMMIANDLDLPKTMAVIDEALATTYPREEKFLDDVSGDELASAHNG